MPDTMQEQVKCVISGDAFLVGAYACPIHVKKYFGKVAKKNKKRAEVRLQKSALKLGNTTLPELPVIEKTDQVAITKTKPIKPPTRL